MKSISKPTIVFAIFLSIWVNVTIGDLPYDFKGFNGFLERLQDVITRSGPNVLPFVAKNQVIEKLNRTSDNFKRICANRENEIMWVSFSFSPLNALRQAITIIYFEYIISNPSSESRRILNEIKSVDPIGLNAYLTEINESNSSPTFMKSVEEFRNTEYKKVPLSNSTYMVEDFAEFTRWIKKISENPSSSNNVLPFVLKNRLIASLWNTSDKFKLFCVDYHAEMKQRLEQKRKQKQKQKRKQKLNQKEKRKQKQKQKRKKEQFTIVSPLSQAIHSMFSEYKQRTTVNDLMILERIESVDPIGLNVYLTDGNVNTSSPYFSSAIYTFYKTMLHREHLFKSGTDDSFITIFEENPSKKLHKVPENIRKEITTEYKPLSHETIDFFMEIAKEQFENIKMYPVATYHSMEKYLPHNSSETDDVQIFYTGEIGSEITGHAICIHYKASSQKVLIYDSAMNNNLKPNQPEIIHKLYPYNTGIVFQRPKTVQGLARNCLVYSLTFATALLLGTDPIEYAFRTNNVYGEDGIYMRMHILNMFANRRLVLME